MGEQRGEVLEWVVTKLEPKYQLLFLPGFRYLIVCMCPCVWLQKRVWVWVCMCAWWRRLDGQAISQAYILTLRDAKFIPLHIRPISCNSGRHSDAEGAMHSGGGEGSSRGGPVHTCLSCPQWESTSQISPSTSRAHSAPGSVSNSRPGSMRRKLQPSGG